MLVGPRRSLASVMPYDDMQPWVVIAVIVLTIWRALHGPRRTSARRPW